MPVLPVTKEQSFASGQSVIHKVWTSADCARMVCVILQGL